MSASTTYNYTEAGFLAQKRMLRRSASRGRYKKRKTSFTSKRGAKRPLDYLYVTRKSNPISVTSKASTEAMQATQSLTARLLKPSARKTMNIVAAGLIIFSSFYGAQAYLLNKKLESEISSVLGGSSESHTPESVAGTSEEITNEKAPTESAIKSYFVAPEEARYLRIPKFGITSRIKPVGKTNEGKVAVPGSVHDVGWYNQSQSINSPSGAMFLVGHVSGPTQKGVFHKLNQLTTGDQIVIEKGDGTEVAFQVIDQNSYNVNSVDMGRALSTHKDYSSKLNINLMTCSGGFDPTSQSYNERFLLSAVQI